MSAAGYDNRIAAAPGASAPKNDPFVRVRREIAEARPGASSEAVITDLGAEAKITLESIIAEKRIVPHFHPVVDCHFGAVLGYEMLSRGAEPLVMPTILFAAAEEHGLLLDLERACRLASLESISRLPKTMRTNTRFFLNVSPDLLGEDGFRSNFVAGGIEQFGVEQDQIVIEITEASSVSDYEHFEKLLRHYVDLGFHIALDDFGVGHGGLVTLVASSPHFIKLDRALVSGIHEDAYKQRLVKAILSFVSGVEGKLVAEGVETAQELETLLRLGVRYAQGFFFGKPAPEPTPPPEKTVGEIARLTRRFHYPRSSHETAVTGMAVRPPVFQVGEVICEEVDLLFRRTPSLDHVVVLDGETPLGLVTRQHFYSVVGGPFGYSLFQKKPVEEICKRNILVVDEFMNITVLGRLAMDRLPDDMYDPVLVRDDDEHFVGAITMKQLLTRSIDLEVRMAADANPLTNLPGNMMIRKWLQESLAAPPYAVIYADLDHFKEYNDCYGFPRGDEMIKLAAKILSGCIDTVGRDAQLGHVGGDDFVIVVRGDVDEDALLDACLAFDREKPALFTAEDVERGFYTACNRKGQCVEVTLVTMSLAVITSDNMGDNPHTASFGQIAAALKKKIKSVNAKTGTSGFLIERRRSGDD